MENDRADEISTYFLKIIWFSTMEVIWNKILWIR